MLKIRLIIALIIILACSTSMHYTYAQPVSEPAAVSSEQTDTASSEADEESEKRQKLDEVLDASDAIDQHTMDQLSDNN